MQTNIAIFASGDVEKLVNRLKIGTPTLELVAGDIVTETIREEIQKLYPMQVDRTIGLRRERLSTELIQDPKTRIVIIDVDKSAEFMDIYSKSAEMYQEKRGIIKLEVSTGNCDASHEKEMFLIGGDKFELLDEIIRLGCDTSLSIAEETFKAAETEAITAVNDEQKTLLTINTSNNPSYEFLSRLGDRKGFAVVKIRTVSEIIEETEEPTSDQVSTLPKVKASKLKKDLDKTKWWATSWETFFEELEEEALEEGYLQEGQEIEDDLSPKK